MMQLPKQRYFWIAFGVQILLMASVPAQAIYTQVTGQSVILKTIPIDPYDPMRGYSVTLRYDISEVELLKTLPGWENLPKLVEDNPKGTEDSSPKENKFVKPRLLKPGTAIYVTLEQQQKSPSNTWQPWKATAISAKLPEKRSPEKVILKGIVSSRNFATSQLIDYGLETYYMPENRSNEVNNAIRDRKSVAEIKVDAQGHGIPLKLRVGDQEFEF